MYSISGDPKSVGDDGDENVSLAADIGRRGVVSALVSTCFSVVEGLEFGIDL